MSIVFGALTMSLVALAGSEVIPKDGLDRLLQIPLTTQCPDTVEAQPIVQTTPPTDWFIHAGGVGSIASDGPFPAVVLAMEGGTYEELIINPVAAVDDDQAGRAGLIDQWGYRTFKMKKLDLTIRVSRSGRVLALYPGPTLKTKEGLGIGSTLGQLIHVYGEYAYTRIPEPYHCSISMRGLDGVHFYFDDCEAACAGGKVKFVYSPGSDSSPDDEPAHTGKPF